MGCRINEKWVWEWKIGRKHEEEVAALSHGVSAPSSTASVGFERRGVR
ncbi:uncharacterized protein G2W53_035119 [Senna tora]|uniref:Uncharacterized protein n=1 Tax=Senna tora TaxID=362788 RepID=A0A834SRS8_9FABA|nr:uncharacterized protein G2W53_035119 [Senna tora]